MNKKPSVNSIGRNRNAQFISRIFHEIISFEYPCYVEILENLKIQKRFLEGVRLRLPDGRSVKDKSVSNANLVLS